jgi:DNA-binding transcriptional LysR family regulator
MHMNWDDFRFLLALAKSGTLSAAAKELKVEHTTVSRRLKRFEATLGRPLFVVDRSGYRLTAFGEEVARRAAAIDDHARSLTDGVRVGERMVGPIRLTTARTLASGYLLPRLLEFSKVHPGIELTVLTDARVLSLARREADIAVRLGRPEDSDLVGAHVADIEYAYFGSADIAERALAGEPFAFVDYEFGNDGREAGWIAKHHPGSSFAFRSNSQLLQADAVRGGVGVGLLPRYLAPGLVRLPWGPLPPKREIWLMTRRDLADAPRIRLLLDALTRWFRSDRAAF